MCQPLRFAFASVNHLHFQTSFGNLSEIFGQNRNEMTFGCPLQANKLWESKLLGEFSSFSVQEFQRFVLLVSVMSMLGNPG